MCQRCLEVLNKYYPHLSESDGYDLLINATCFPAGGPEDIERQLKELREKTDGSLNAALAFADEELERDMQNYATQP